MTQGRDTGAPAVLDPSVLRGLCRSMGDDQAVRSFVTRYRDGVPERLDRIETAVREHDDEQALVASLSLRTSSAMIGLPVLEHRLARFESALRGGAPGAIRRSLAEVSAAAREVCERLRTLLETYVSPGRSTSAVERDASPTGGAP